MAFKVSIWLLTSCYIQYFYLTVFNFISLCYRYFYSANDNYDKEKEEYYGLTISSNGEVGWFYPTIFKSSCTIDVTYFPFDDQVTTIQF